MDKEVLKAIESIVHIGFKILAFALAIIIGFIGGIFSTKI